MRNRLLLIVLLLASSLLLGCAGNRSRADSFATPGMATDCPPSASSYHDREGMGALRPGDCRPAPAMKLPMGTRDKR